MEGWREEGGKRKGEKREEREGRREERGKETRGEERKEKNRERERHLSVQAPQRGSFEIAVAELDTKSIRSPCYYLTLLLGHAHALVLLRGPCPIDSIRGRYAGPHAALPGAALASFLRVTTIFILSICFSVVASSIHVWFILDTADVQKLK